MSFIEEIKNRAKQQIKTIILPEATDIRILKAAQIINKEKYAKVALIGNKEEIEKLIKENNLELGDTQIIDPAKSDKTSEYAKELYELRKAKGMTEEQAQKLILEPIYYGMIVAILNYHSSVITIMVKNDNFLCVNCTIKTGTVREQVRNLLKQLLFSSRQAFLLSKTACKAA